MAGAGVPYSTSGALDNRIKAEKHHVQEVVDIMRDNVNRVLERENRLAEISDRTDELQVQSRQFETVTKRVQRKYFWQNMKMWAILIMVGAAIIVAIIVWAATDKS